jgi:hypothetical protein
MSSKGRLVPTDEGIKRLVGLIAEIMLKSPSSTASDLQHGSRQKFIRKATSEKLVLKPMAPEVLTTMDLYAHHVLRSGASGLIKKRQLEIERDGRDFFGVPPAVDSDAVKIKRLSSSSEINDSRLNALL